MLTAALSLPQSFPILRVWHDGSGRPCSSILRRLIRRLGIHVAATSVTATTALGDIACDATGIPRILPGVVDTSQFNPELDSAQLRLDLGFQASDHVVGLTARWKPGRGHEDFLQAFQRASQTAPALRALLIGRGELEKDFGQLIQRLGLAHAVKLFSPGNRFIETLSVCDAAVLMAPGSDGHCRAALEWLSLEKPLFLTQRGALQDFASIEPAICLSCESQEELTAALIRSAQSPQSHQHIAAAGRKHILSCHNEQVVRQHISDLCSELIPVAS